MAIFYKSSLHLKLNSQSTLLRANFPMITVGSLFRIRAERMESKHLDRSDDLCGPVDGALIHAAIMLNLHSSAISVLSRNCGFAFRYSIIWVPLFLDLTYLYIIGQWRRLIRSDFCGHTQQQIRIQACLCILICIHQITKSFTIKFDAKVNKELRHRVIDIKKTRTAF